MWPMSSDKQSAWTSVGFFNERWPEFHHQVDNYFYYYHERPTLWQHLPYDSTYI